MPLAVGGLRSSSGRCGVLAGRLFGVLVQPAVIRSDARTTSLFMMHSSGWEPAADFLARLCASQETIMAILLGDMSRVTGMYDGSLMS